MKDNIEKSKIQRCGKWDEYDHIPVWSVISTSDVAKIYNVSLNAVQAWKMRGYIEPIEHPRLPKNKSWFVIHELKARLEESFNDSLESEVWRWGKRWLPDDIRHIKNLMQLEGLVNAAYDVFGVAKPKLESSFNDKHNNNPYI